MPLREEQVWRQCGEITGRGTARFPGSVWQKRDTRVTDEEVDRLVSPSDLSRQRLYSCQALFRARPETLGTSYGLGRGSRANRTANGSSCYPRGAFPPIHAENLRGGQIPALER